MEPFARVRCQIVGGVSATDSYPLVLTAVDRWRMIKFCLFKRIIGMRNAVTIVALVLTIGVSACATRATEEGFSRADQDAIRKNAADLTAAFNAKEVDKVLSFYADTSIFMPPNAPLLRGREPLRSFYNNLIAKGAADLTLEPAEIAGHGPIAYQSGTYSLSYTSTGHRDRGKYLLLLRNMSGTWRTEKTIWSSDLPPTPQPTE